MDDSILGTTFQYGFYALLTLFNLAVQLLGLVGFAITLLVKKFAAEFARNSAEPVAQSQRIDHAIAESEAEILKDLNGKEPFGRVIGIVECQLYYYALMTTPSLISPILIFKAFSNWLSFKADNTPDGEAKSIRTLARFYSYAIGNFISLAWAIFSFELARILIQKYEPLRAFVWLN
ncbi:hypothetical protein [Ancylobacter sp.]|uniref:hypothetical protein n=1 Tax=Ancylobacter sp. TaxID=1872567 RepID=UPI003D128F82